MTECACANNKNIDVRSIFNFAYTVTLLVCCATFCDRYIVSFRNLTFTTMSVNHKKTSHKAKTDSQWIERLRRFAAGEMFHRGENPRKNSRWHRVVERIQACPAHRDASMACVCQYHQPVSFARYQCYNYYSVATSNAIVRALLINNSGANIL